MIKNPHSLAELDAIAILYYKDIKTAFHLRQTLAAEPNDEIKPVMAYLHQNLDEIIVGRPDRLEYHITQVQPLIDVAKANYRIANPVILVAGTVLTPGKMNIHVNNWAKNRIKRIFNYDFENSTSFTQRDSGALAYRHAKRLNMNSCPYCNAHFTYTIKNQRLKTRPEFDHFLNKGRYPFLALSFYNLIPSCSLCNSGALKGQKPFSISTHLHPFIDNIEGIYQFRTRISAVDFLVNGEDFTLTLQPCPGTTRATRAKAKKSISVFAIDDRYKFHKDYAEEILKKAYVYNNAAVETLLKSLKIGGHSIFNSEEEIKELVMGNYLHLDRFHKRIFSKLTKDIAEEFGLTL